MKCDPLSLWGSSRNAAPPQLSPTNISTQDESFDEERTQKQRRLSRKEIHEFRVKKIEEYARLNVDQVEFREASNVKINDDVVVRKLPRQPGFSGKIVDFVLNELNIKKKPTNKPPNDYHVKIHLPADDNNIHSK